MNFKRPHINHMHDFLPWLMYIEENIILLKTGAFLSFYEYCGKDLSFSSEDTLAGYFYQVNQALNRLGNGFALFIECSRQKSRSFTGDTAVAGSLALQTIQSEHRVNFSETFSCHYYLGVTYTPPVDVSSRLSAFFSSKSNDLDYEQHLNYFRRQVTELVDILSLLMEIRPLSEAETLSYLHSCISDREMAVGVPDKPYLMDFLADTTLVGGTAPQIGRQHLGIISVQRFPHSSCPEMLSALNQLQFPFRWCSRFICMDKTEAMTELERRSKAYFAQRRSLFTLVKQVFFPESVGDERLNEISLAYAEECEEAKALAETDQTSFGYFTSTVIVLDTDESQLAEKVKAIQKVFNSSGVLTVEETFNAVDGYAGTLPGNCKANVRRYLLSSLNAAHLSPLTADYTGENDNSLLHAKTTGNSRFNLSINGTGVSHGGIIGETGSGKSFPFKYMSASFLKDPDSTVYLFDKDYSAYCFTKMMNGIHYDFAKPENKLMPLADIHDPQELNWAYSWLLLVLGADLAEISGEQKQELSSALQSLSLLPHQQRTLTGLHSLLQDHTLKTALEPYLSSGVNGLLDADEDNFKTTRLVTFEMGSLLSDSPHLVAPVTTLQFHRIENSLHGQRALLGVDESAIFWDYPTFRSMFRNSMKVMRKKRCGVWFITQSLADIAESKISHSLIEGVPNKIYTAHNQLDNDLIKDTYRSFGLNDQEIQAIKNATPQKEYLFKNADGTQLIDFGIKSGSATQAICGSDSKADIKKMRELEAAGLDHSELFNRFLAYKGVEI